MCRLQVGRAALQFLSRAIREVNQVALGFLNKYAKLSNLAFLENNKLCMFLLLSIQSF